MGNVILFGEPMALLIAESTAGKGGTFYPGTFRGRGKCGDRPDKAWPPGRIPDPAGGRSLRILYCRYARKERDWNGADHL